MSSADETPRSLFVVGLRNAHAMEREAISMMESQISSIETYPEVKTKLQQHLEETRGQDERLERILGELGEDTSTFKDVVMGFMGSANSMAASMADDAILKATFANFAFENFETAAYKSLLKMAEINGSAFAVPLLQQSLDEEVAMSRWIEQHVEDVTARYVKLSHAGTDASL
jgi:ferritin-like metal-binding protein YciE